MKCKKCSQERCACGKVEVKSGSSGQVVTCQGMQPPPLGEPNDREVPWGAFPARSLSVGQ